MVNTQCDARPVKAYIMSDILKKFDYETTNDFVQIAVAIAGFYMGVFYLEYVDTEYSLWLTWFLTPVIVTFLLPAVIIVLIYLSSIIFHLYRLYRLRVVGGVHSDWRHAARLAVCALWDAHGWLWHGYEVRGFEHIPDGPFLLIYYHGALPIDMYYFNAKALLFKRRYIHTVADRLLFKIPGYEIRGFENLPDGPVLIIYYHGALPVDMYYFIARMQLFQRKHIHTVADRLLFKIPGWASLLEGLCVIPGTVQTCASVLRAGNPLAISPGGVYEAQFGDHYYRLNWRSRIGFAKVALEAKVPIVPMFTQNVREAFRTVGWLRGVWLKIYATFRIPLAPVYGGFPVKLITHLGKPIQYEPDMTPDQLQLKVAKAIEDLIEEHQRIPGNILLALTERIYEMPKKKTKTIEVQPGSNGKCQNGGVKENGLSDSCQSESAKVS